MKLLSRFLYSLALLLIIEPGSLWAQKGGNSLSDTSLLSHFLEQAQFELTGNFDTDKAQLFLDSAKQIQAQTGDDQAKIEIENICGLIHRSRSEYAAAIECHLKALELAENFKDKSAQAKTLNNIAVAWRRTDNHPQAIKYHLDALNAAKDISNKTTQMYALNGLGNSFLQIQNYDRALEYFEKAYNIALEVGNKESQAINLNNIGDTYVSMKRYQKAYQYFTGSLNINLEIKSQVGIIISYISLGKSLYHLKRYDEAVGYLRKVLNSPGFSEDKFHTASAKIELGRALIPLKKFSEAEKYLREGLEAAKELKSKYNISKAYKIFSDLYKKNKQFKKAYEYAMLHSLMKDSLVSDEIQKKTFSIQVSNRLDQNREKVKLLQKEKENRKIKSRQQLIIVIASGLIILLFTIYYFLIRQFRQKNKSNQQLKSLLKEKEVLIAEIHHRVKNNLALIAGLIQIQANNKNNSAEVQTLEEIHSRVFTFSLIYENLYDAGNFGEINFANYLKKYVRNFSYKFNANHIKMEIQAENTIFSLKTAVPLALICNELITNCYKHAFKGMNKGKITIELKQQKKQDKLWKLSVSDNGIGAEKSPEYQNSTGYMIININSRQLNADFNIKTETGKGFEFELLFNSEMKKIAGK